MWLQRILAISNMAAADGLDLPHSIGVMELKQQEPYLHHLAVIVWITRVGKVWPFVALECIILAFYNKLVEAAGVEPASENAPLPYLHA